MPRREVVVGEAIIGKKALDTITPDQFKDWLKRTENMSAYDKGYELGKIVGKNCSDSWAKNWKRICRES